MVWCDIVWRVGFGGFGVVWTANHSNMIGPRKSCGGGAAVSMVGMWWFTVWVGLGWGGMSLVGLD